MRILFAALALIGLAFPAMAIDQNGPTQSNPAVFKSSAVSGAVAASRSSAQSSSISGGSSSSLMFNLDASQPDRVRYDFSGGVKSVPDVYAPALAGGNPCVVSVSAGAGWLGAGFSFGMGLQDEGCETRAQAALLGNLGKPDLALSHMCLHLDAVRETIEANGGKCSEGEGCGDPRKSA